MKNRPRTSENDHFSAQRKSEAVLRLLCGEALDVLSRAYKVTAAKRSQWREAFLAAGQAGLRPSGSEAHEAQIKKLQAPQRRGHLHGPSAHDGTIITDQPDQMWGTDATTTRTQKEGPAHIFVSVDHCTFECIGLHASAQGHRFEALEPIRQGVREHVGGYAAQQAVGLTVRHDHGSVYPSDDFQNELDFLGIESSPSFVRQSQGNECVERFIGLLKENLLWVYTFATVEELRCARSLSSNNSRALQTIISNWPTETEAKPRPIQLYCYFATSLLSLKRRL